MGRAKTSARKSSAKPGSDVPESSSETKSSDTKTKSGAARKSRKASGRRSPSNGSPKNGNGRTSRSPPADIAESAKIEPPPDEVAQSDETMSPEEIEKARKSYLLKRFWVSARGFWGESGERIAWIASVGLPLLIVFYVAVQYGINVWNRKIFDAIEKRDSVTVLWLSAVFFPLALTSVMLGVAQVYARMGIQRRWRAWLTNQMVSRWLNHGRYYQLNLVAGEHKNPEYRIAEDLRVATDAPVDFVAGVTSALLSAITFIVVLWTIGGALNVSLGGTTLTIPGFLVIAAIAYAGLASSAMAVIGRRFVAISESRNQAEAEFRYVLTRVRENGESIALLGGEAEERDGIDKSFRRVRVSLRRWFRCCCARLNFLTAV